MKNVSAVAIQRCPNQNVKPLEGLGLLDIVSVINQNDATKKSI